jgi:hypothetical protein
MGDETDAVIHERAHGRHYTAVTCVAKYNRIAVIVVEPLVESTSGRRQTSEGYRGIILISPMDDFARRDQELSYYQSLRRGLKHSIGNQTFRR